MNIRNVLKAYSLLRQLSDDETALLTTLRNLNDSEREQLVESLVPTKGTGKGAKKKRSTKSPRATSLQQQIQATKRPALCTYIMTINGNSEPCQGTENDAVHDKDAGYAGYHPFESSSPARSAAKGSSSKNGSPDTSGASSEVEMESASGVMGD